MTSANNKAVALQYQDAEELPKVVAMGYGEIARLILLLAEKSEVPIHEDDRLSDILPKLTLGSEIHQESFRLVAEILAFLYQIDSDWREQHTFLGDLLTTNQDPS